MKISEKFNEIKAGFQKPFWVANIMELFERIAYYGQATILSIYLRDHLKFDEMQAGQLASIFGGLIYFLPIFAGALADKFGFRKAFSFAFIVLSAGYFMIGISGTPLFRSFFGGIDLFWILIIVLIFTSIGGSFIKPSVLGTVAMSSSAQTKSLGYAIYYWLVNIGGAVGPLIAFFVRDLIGIQAVYMVSAISCLLMFISTLVFYRNPAEMEIKDDKDLKVLILNLFKVVTNLRFMAFLLIFSLYWLMFWQIFVIIPFYITDHISKDAPFEIIMSVGAWGIILLQLIINRLTRKLAPISAIIAGFSISSLCWGIIFLNPSIPFMIAGILTFSIGEQTQAPRFYEYVADLAPKGQAAMYQGYAFLPIAIGWFFGGMFGGWLYKSFALAGKQNPNIVFLFIFGIGAIATMLMYFYNLSIKRTKLN